MISIDTREQNNTHIIRYFNKNNIDYYSSKMNIGDYENVESEKLVVVERKKNLIEFANNVGKGHARFKSELERAKQLGYKIYILIEQKFDYVDLLFWKNPKAKTLRKLKDGTIKEIRPITGEQIYKVCQSWKEKYNIEFVFCDKKESPQKILELLEVDNA